MKVNVNKISQKFKNYGIGCLDVGKQSIYCYVENCQGDYLDVFSFSQDIDGFTKCQEALIGFQKTESLSGVLMGIESTGTYGDAITSYLLSNGINMVGVNPKHVHRMKELVDNSPLKSDKKDPKVGTLVVKNGRFHHILQPKSIAADLRSLSKHRQQLKIHENRILNQLESHIVRIFPEFIKVMIGLDRVTSIYLLEQYALPEQIVSLGQSKLFRIIRKKSRYQLRQERAKALYMTAKHSIGIKEGVIGISLAIKDLVNQLKLIKKQIALSEEKLKELVNQHEEGRYLLSMPDIGVVTASELIGETGGLNNYSNSDKLLKLAGLSLYEISSGKHRGLKELQKGVDLLSEERYTWLH
jgi:transposase